MQQNQNYPHTTPVTINENQATDVAQARPWVRLLARAIDVFSFAFFFGLFFMKLGFPLWGDIYSTIVGLLCLLVWVFVEAAFLSTWGTTFGKWLLKIKITDAEGKKLTYARALKRSFLVWFKGLGMGLPFVIIVTLLVAHYKLKKNKITTWDKAENLLVTHKKIGRLRVIIGILIVMVSDYALWYVSEILLMLSR